MDSEARLTKHSCDSVEKHGSVKSAIITNSCGCDGAGLRRHFTTENILYRLYRIGLGRESSYVFILLFFWLLQLCSVPVMYTGSSQPSHSLNALGLDLEFHASFALMLLIQSSLRLPCIWTDANG